ncbi:MAG: class I SAM-dependent methyltransferase [Dehalococcoidia bacterium]|nr:MAG: class I SAM-dependent methyltransferase [Dehalococcoidia bacterium]
MFNRIESYVEENLNPLYRAHYALWIYWWPIWRSAYSGPQIRKNWDKFDLVKPGQSFLDFGCGTGCFSLPAAKIVQNAGTVYALDCFPRQLDIVKKRAHKAGVTNIVTILSEEQGKLEDKSMDVVWMCDVFHEIMQKRQVLEEIHRVIKPGGTLAIYDDWIDKVAAYTDGLFVENSRAHKIILLKPI